MNRKSLPLFLLMTVLLGLATAGCNTMSGVGKDMERAGEKVQENANSRR